MKRWRQQPLAWLGAAIFLASLAGCIAIIVLAARYPDDPLPTASEQLFRMPPARGADGAAVPRE